MTRNPRSPRFGPCGENFLPHRNCGEVSHCTRHVVYHRAFETVHLVLTVHPVYVYVKRLIALYVSGCQLTGGHDRFLVTDYGQLAIVLSTAPVPWYVVVSISPQYTNWIPVGALLPVHSLWYVRFSISLTICSSRHPGAGR